MRTRCGLNEGPLPTRERVSEYLGHADPGFTLRVYAHLMPTSDEKARRAIDAALTTASVTPLPEQAGMER